MKKVLFSCALIVAVFSTVTLAALDEPAVEKKMKSAGEAMGAIRKAMQAGSMPDVATHAKQMVEALSEVDDFWKSRNMANAAKWQVEAQVAAKALLEAASAGNVEAARAASGKMGGACKQCHEAHREKVAENKYRIKQ